jgi:transposase-like protein
MCDLNNPIFTDKDAAREHLEKTVWPDGPVCPHCGSVEKISKVEGKKKSHRPGLYYCGNCDGQFTVTVGTVYERSKVPLNKWLLATHLLASSKKGMSAHQLHRMLGVTYKTAWFMAHRIREAMRDDAPSGMGGDGGVVEADETYHGKPEEPRVSPQRKGRPYKYRSMGPRNSRPIVALVERGGNVRSFHVAVADKKNVTKIVRNNIVREARLHTDESRLYSGSAKHFSAHETVRHSDGEYVRDDVHTNSVEGFFSIFKRGMRGVYQHCKEKHLHRYLAEFDFRYNTRTALGVTDAARATKALEGIKGKRLTYRRTYEAGL